MNILLICPTFDYAKDVEEEIFKTSAPTLGVNTLGTILRKKGHKVIVLDLLYHLLCNRYDGNMSFLERIKEIIKKKDIEIVGITVLTHLRGQAIEIAKITKDINSDIKVVFGSYHSSYMHKQMLENYSRVIDFVCIGEGEETFPELIKVIEKKENLNNVRGIAFNDSIGKVIVTQSRPYCDFDSLPSLDYSQYIEISPDKKLNKAMLFTTRGCPSPCCIFCSTKFLDKKFRVRSIQNVIRDLEILSKDYGVREISFHDDTIFFDKERSITIFKEMIQRKIKFENVYMHCRIEDIDKDILKWANKADCNSIFLGVESGSQKIRNILKKPNSSSITNDIIIEKINIIKEAGRKVGIFLIFGNPDETLDDIKETYRLMEKINPDDSQSTTLKIYPGTQLFQLAKKKGIIKENDFLNLNIPYFTYARGNNFLFARAARQVFMDKFENSSIRSKFEGVWDDLVTDFSKDDLERIEMYKEKIIKYISN